MDESLPSREAWIEIKQGTDYSAYWMSLPSREAWIEITLLIAHCFINSSLPSREAWIEIAALCPLCVSALCRFPRGKRGLKF